MWPYRAKLASLARKLQTSVVISVLSVFTVMKIIPFRIHLSSLQLVLVPCGSYLRTTHIIQM